MFIVSSLDENKAQSKKKTLFFQRNGNRQLLQLKANLSVNRVRWALASPFKCCGMEFSLKGPLSPFIPLICPFVSF